MYIAMDMGTSNTRIWLCDKERIIGSYKRPFGAKLGSTNKNALFGRLTDLISESLSQNGVTEEDVECILTSGMAGSEIGLCEIPHISLPTDVYRNASMISQKRIPEITKIPFWFVPGVKEMHADLLADIIRGEETEIFGILPHLPKNTPAVVLLPGTHNKIIRLNEAGEITDFKSTASGELLDIIISHSILAGSISHDFTFSETHAKQGMEYAHENGISAAIFHVRVMAKNGTPHDLLSSFIYGAVIGEDIKMIRKYAGENTIFVGGNEKLQAVYCSLLGKDYAVSLNSEIAASATLHGLQQIYGIYKSL